MNDLAPNSHEAGWRLTGWHVLALFVGGFGIIIAVNLTLAFKAVSTFPGLETPNSYVASQEFDARRAAQEALGWQVVPTVTEDRVTVRVEDAEGNLVRPAAISAILGRPTQVADDIVPEFSWNGTAFTAPVTLPYGAWSLRLKMTAADGTEFQRLYPLAYRPED